MSSDDDEAAALARSTSEQLLREYLALARACAASNHCRPCEKQVPVYREALRMKLEDRRD